MKKALFLLIPLVIGLSACDKNSGKSSETPIPNIELVNQLKDLLNKQDLSDFHSKALGTMFTQEYDVLDVYKDEDERVSNHFNYIGLGFLDYYYDLSLEEYNSTVDENGDVNIFDAIKEGEGGYRISQLAYTTSMNRDGGFPAKVENLVINQQMTLKATEEDINVYNILDVTDNEAFEYESRQKFNGQISKEILFDSVSTESFRDIFSNVHLFDAPSTIEYLDKLYFLTCRELKDMSDKEISDFIIETNISLEEVEETIELSFTYSNERIDEEHQDIVFPGDILGTLKYDKTSGEFLEFNYKIQYLNNNYDEESGSSNTANMAFECTGISGRAPMGDMWLPSDPTVYTDAISFLEDVREEVIPPSIYQ